MKRHLKKTIRTWISNENRDAKVVIHKDGFVSINGVRQSFTATEYHEKIKANMIFA